VKRPLFIAIWQYSGAYFAICSYKAEPCGREADLSSEKIWDCSIFVDRSIMFIPALVNGMMNNLDSSERSFADPISLIELSKKANSACMHTLKTKYTFIRSESTTAFGSG